MRIIAKVPIYTEGASTALEKVEEAGWPLLGAAKTSHDVMIKFYSIDWPDHHA